MNRPSDHSSVFEEQAETQLHLAEMMENVTFEAAKIFGAGKVKQTLKEARDDEFKQKSPTEEVRLNFCVFVSKRISTLEEGRSRCCLARRY
jgi:hypothetical protein